MKWRIVFLEPKDNYLLFWGKVMQSAVNGVSLNHSGSLFRCMSM